MWRKMESGRIHMVCAKDPVRSVTENGHAVDECFCTRSKEECDTWGDEESQSTYYKRTPAETKWDTANCGSYEGASGLTKWNRQKTQYWPHALLSTPKSSVKPLLKRPVSHSHRLDAIGSKDAMRTPQVPQVITEVTRIGLVD